jgi:hypothetical protein
LWHRSLLIDSWMGSSAVVVSGVVAHDPV